MSATDEESGTATGATPPVRLRFDQIDRRAAELGVTTEVGLADLLDLDRTSLWRFRRERLNPSLETALRIADRLDLAVEEVAELTGQVAS